jgi:hypothetical protein
MSNRLAGKRANRPVLGQLRGEAAAEREHIEPNCFACLFGVGGCMHPWRAPLGSGSILRQVRASNWVLLEPPLEAYSCTAGGGVYERAKFHSAEAHLVLYCHGLSDNVTQNGAKYDVGQIMLTIVDPLPADESGEYIGRNADERPAVFI